jgi:4-amino-4-deoxy-L-arabinose transferase-like glycosyltransferase
MARWFATKGKTDSTTLLLAGVLLVSLALRVYGVGFGLPDLYYWDEPTVVNRAVRFGSGDLNPHYFYYPAFYKYVLFAVTGVYYVGGRLLGAFQGAEDFAAGYFTDPTGVYVAARLMTALVGTAAVYVAYKLGERYLDRRVGLVAALLLAVSPLHASYAHVAITDTAHAFLIALALLPLHGVFRNGRTVHYVLSGFLIGLGVATKYLALLMVATLVVAHCLRDDRFRDGRPSLGALAKSLLDGRLVLGVGMVLLGFFVGSPYNLLAFDEFMRDFRAQSELSSGDGRLAIGIFAALVKDLGWPACLLAVVGFGTFVRKPSRLAVVLFTFPILYSLLVLVTSKTFERYLLPLSVFVCLLAALGLMALGAALGSLPALAGRVQPRVLTVLLAIVAVFGPARRTLEWDVLMAEGPDPRTLARSWTEANVAPGTRVAIQSLYDRSFENAPLVTRKVIERLERIVPTTGRFGGVRERILDVWRARRVYDEVAWSSDVEALKSQGVRYVFLTDAYGEPPPAVKAWLEREGVVRKRFRPALPRSLEGLPSGNGVLAVIPPTITVVELREPTRVLSARAQPSSTSQSAGPWSGGL